MICQSGKDDFGISSQKLSLLTCWIKTVHAGKHGQTRWLILFGLLIYVTAPVAVYPSSKHRYGNWLGDSLSTVHFISVSRFIYMFHVRTTLHIVSSPGNSAFVLPPEISLAFLGGAAESVNLWDSVLSLSFLSPAEYNEFIILNYFKNSYFRKFVSIWVSFTIV